LGFLAFAVSFLLWVLKKRKVEMRGGVSEIFRLDLLLVVFILFLCKYESPFFVHGVLDSLLISWMICEYILEIHQILLKNPAGV